MTVQASLCQTWSETQIVVFLMTKLKLFTGVKYKAFEIIGTQLMVCQAIAVLEVIHPLLGLVKTGVISPLMQVHLNLIITCLIIKRFS